MAERPNGWQPITEEPAESGLPWVTRPDWADRHPWLLQGVTIRTNRADGGPHAPGGGGFDLGLRGPASGGRTLSNWGFLRRRLGVARVVLAHQVHGAAVRTAQGGSEGLLLAPPSDGHLTREPGVLLAVTVADCVPVFLVEPESRSLGLLHAGWRGIAEGILEAGIGAMWDRFGVPPDRLHLHLGPAISGPRYEVGPEVHRALGRPEPGGAATLDLRLHLAGRAIAAGVPPGQVGVSTLCVHDDPRFFSHRGGDAGRQVGFLGFRGRPGVRR